MVYSLLKLVGELMMVGVLLWLCRCVVSLVSSVILVLLICVIVVRFSCSMLLSEVSDGYRVVVVVWLSILLNISVVLL